MREGGEKCRKALEIKPDYYPALHNWGIILTSLNKIRGDEKLLKEAGEKFRKALEIKPDDYIVLYNLGVLMELRSEFLKRKDLLYEALEKYKESWMHIRSLKNLSHPNMIRCPLFIIEASLNLNDTELAKNTLEELINSFNKLTEALKEEFYKLIHSFYITIIKQGHYNFATKSIERFLSSEIGQKFRSLENFKVLIDYLNTGDIKHLQSLPPELRQTIEEMVEHVAKSKN